MGDLLKYVKDTVYTIFPILLMLVRNMIQNVCSCGAVEASYDTGSLNSTLSSAEIFAPESC